MNKNDEINKFINIFNENFSKFHNMSFRKQLEVFYDQIKDNPVPSIDKEFTKEDMCSFGLFLGSNLRKNRNQKIDILLDKFLQNGVETDKEGPNEIEKIIQRAIKFSDFSKLPKKKIDFEEEYAPIKRVIKIIESTISTHMEVDGVDLTDDSIEW